MTPPIRAGAFTSSIGVAAQLAALSGPVKSAATLQVVSYLGVSNIRTGLTAALLAPGSVAEAHARS